MDWLRQWVDDFIWVRQALVVSDVSVARSSKDSAPTMIFKRAPFQIEKRHD